MKKFVDQINDSELLAKLQWIEVNARSAFIDLHGLKMCGPRNDAERAILEIEVACEEAGEKIKKALKVIDQSS